MPKQKYYAVRVGRKTGVFTSWKECEEYVLGFDGARYKSFPTFEEADAFVNGVDSDKEKKDIKECFPTDPEKRLAAYIEKAEKDFSSFDVASDSAIAYVDGSFDAKKNEYAYGVVFISSKGIETFCGKNNVPEFVTARNVAGELDGTMFAAKLAVGRNISSLNIYHDYMGIAAWYNGTWRASTPVSVNYIFRMSEICSGLSVSFHKVEAHTGIYLNEAADLLAKSALK